MKIDSQIKAKRFLASARFLDKETKNLYDRIQEMRVLREKVTSTISSSVAKSRGEGSRIDNLTAQIVVMEEKFRKKVQEYLQRYRQIEKVIEKVEEKDFRLACILRLRYLDGDRWENISDELNYEPSWLHRLHRASIKEVITVMNKAK